MCPPTPATGNNGQQIQPMCLYLAPHHHFIEGRGFMNQTFGFTIL